MWRASGENHFRCVEVEDLAKLSNVTIDGRHPAPVLRLVVFSIIYRVFYIPGGCLGFLNHLQACFGILVLIKDTVLPSYQCVWVPVFDGY